MTAKIARTTREDLHILVDLLPEGAWDEANVLLQECLEDAEGETVVYDPMDAPEVPPTPGEIAAMEEAYAELREGKAELIPHEEVVKYLRELP